MKQGDIINTAEGHCVVLDIEGKDILAALLSGTVGTVRLQNDDILGADMADSRLSSQYVDIWNLRRWRTYSCTGFMLAPTALDRILRAMGKKAATAHYNAFHVSQPFVPGQSPVPVSGKKWGHREVEYLTEASMDFWLTAGRFNEAFEKEFALKTGRRFALSVNSGSSANLLAVSALFSPLLKSRRLKAGDEVVTVAAGFPTTVAPLVQYGLVPVFVDVELGTYNALADQVAAAITPKTRAVMLAHTLGNPFDIAAIQAIVEKYNLWFIEDSCDALGSCFALNGESKWCGSFGHIASFSFYPAHHITMGEGGAVACDDPLLHKILLSMRDWGRDCWCAPGRDNTCGQRYSKNFPKLPRGYDHKYIYSHLGYNLKVTDMQAAVGLAQLKSLDEFTAARRHNFATLHQALAPLADYGLLLPKATPGSDPSWFGFPLTLGKEHNRQALLKFLNSRNIGTRLLFAGNISCQPCFEGVDCRMPFPLTNTDTVMNQTFWIGVCPSLTESHLGYLAESLSQWLKK